LNNSRLLITLLGAPRQQRYARTTLHTHVPPPHVREIGGRVVEKREEKTIAPTPPRYVGRKTGGKKKSGSK